MASAFPLIGKHRHVQRYILSYLKPNELRIARYVFRECPLPADRNFDSVPEYAKQLMREKAFNLFCFEVEKHYMDPIPAIIDAFKVNAPAHVIACIANRTYWSRGVEFHIGEFRRYDVLALRRRS